MFHRVIKINVTSQKAEKDKRVCTESLMVNRSTFGRKLTSYLFIQKHLSELCGQIFTRRHTRRLSYVTLWSDPQTHKHKYKHNSKDKNDEEHSHPVERSNHTLLFIKLWILVNDISPSPDPQLDISNFTYVKYMEFLNNSV